MAIVGFDFGTTNSLVSVIEGGRAIRFLDDQGLPVPSVVCYEGSKVIVGAQAKERLGEAGLGVQGNVVRSPKMLLGRESVFVGGVERSPVDIVRDVVEYVRTQAQATRRVKNLKIDKVVVTIPVNMEGRRRAALRDAFRLAGIGIVQFIHEPLAALYGHFRSEGDYASMLRRYDRQLMLVFDWGGGTLDVTLCRLIDGLLVQVINDGTDEVGGDIFDDTLKNEIEKRVRAARKLGDDAVIQPDAMTRLMHRCERAKIDLSTRTRAQLFVSNFYRGVEDPDLEYSLSRDELESIVAHLLDGGLVRIYRLLSASGYTPASVALCLATGGMAGMPAIRTRLHELFGPQRVHVSAHSATLISEGAAWVAHDDARLSLAKNVELLLARNSYMSLIQAGTEMPREGQVRKENFGLYCADPRDGFAKFQLHTPLRPGAKVLPNDSRRSLVNLLVDVDGEAKPFFERLELDVEIDENLILHAHARSLNKKGYANSEVHNLEFALTLPDSTRGPISEDELVDLPDSATRNETGSIVMRSNISKVAHDSMVPGELLYMINPGYFDQRNNPPYIQDLERLYYVPCSLCGRASNDPLCRCATALREAASNEQRQSP